MTLEQIIKRALDGTFTRLDSNGKSVTVDVDVDFIPKHHQQAGRAIGPAGKQIPFTPEDDLIILELKRRRVAAWDIAEKLGRTEDSVRHRIRHLGGGK